MTPFNSQTNKQYMSQIEKLKQQVYAQAQQSGLFKQMQAQLKTQVLTALESQPSHARSTLKFSYEHPLLPKLQKYNLTHLCLDLIQEFLESFKFQYTLSVFMKEINRSGKVNRQQLAKELKLQTNQAVMLTVVDQLKNGETIRKKEVHPSGQKQTQKQGQKQQQKPIEVKTAVEVGDDKTNKKKEQEGEKLPTETQKPKKKEAQKQREDKHVAQSSVSQQGNVKIKIPQPKTAADFMGSLLSKASQNDQTKKPSIMRAMSAPPAPIKSAPPPETGANKISGGAGIIKASPIAGLLKHSSVGSKDPYAYDIKPKTALTHKKPIDEQIEEDIDVFQQSRDSTRRNPLFSSTEEGLQSMGYDQSVDSLAIQEYDHYQAAKKKKK